MATRSNPSTDPDEILMLHGETVEALARAVRDCVLAAMPEATERVNRGWQGLAYHHPAAGYVCGVFVLKEMVKLGFEFGALLADHNGRLSGNGLQVRYLEIRDHNDVDAAAIADFIRQAVALPPERSARLAMLREQRS